jgi:hypothetical protein
MEVTHGLLIVVLLSTCPGYKGSLSKQVQKDSPHKVKLDDGYQYPIKGVGV